MVIGSKNETRLDLLLGGSWNLVPGPQKVCKIMAFMAIIMRLGLLFYILLGFR